MGSFYRSKHELVFVYKVGTGPHVNTVELGKNGRYRTNVWDYAGVNTWRAGRDADLEMHPTVKPTALVIDAIKDCSRRGDIVLDAFSGSGTTIIAAHKCRRRARAIELDPLYVDVAIRRWQNYTGESATMAITGETFAEVEERRGDPFNERAGPIDVNLGKACNSGQRCCLGLIRMLVCATQTAPHMRSELGVL